MPLGRRRRRRGRTQRPPAGPPAGSPPSPRPVRGQVTVKKALLVARLTCPLCLGLLQDAATIPECLHTFCSKCITKRLVDYEEERCPVCKRDLGFSAADKLRSDHHLQYLRDKLFPIKRKRTQSEREITTIPIQIQTQKVKERSLSSLVAAAAARSRTSKMLFDATDECSSPSLIGNARKKAKHAQLKEEKNMDPPEEPAMVTYTRKQVSPDVDSSSIHSQQKEGGNKKESNSIKPENSIPAIKIKIGSVTPPNGHKLKLSCTSEEIKDNGKKLRRRRRKGSSRKENISSQDLQTKRPIWFSLIASSNPEGGTVLPQLTANFLRIKDGEMNVSSIQKYVKNKLGLGAQTEVEIVCRGQAMNPDMTVHGLMNMWIRNESSHKVNTAVGSSAKDFVMVLSYHLKFQSQI